MMAVPNASEIKNSPLLPAGTFVVMNPRYASHLKNLSSLSDYPDQYPVESRVYTIDRDGLRKADSKVIRLSEIPHYRFYSVYFLPITEADD